MKPEMHITNLLSSSNRPNKATSGPTGALRVSTGSASNTQSDPKEGVSIRARQKNSAMVAEPKFKKMLDAVTRENKKAQAEKKSMEKKPVSDDRSVSSGDVSENDAREVNAQHLGTKISQSDLNGASENVVDSSSDSGAGGAADQQLQQATQIILEAIAKISKTLNMKINTGLETLQLQNPSQNVIDQFAEIVTALKGIAGALEEAVKNNQPVEISGKGFDASQASTAQQTILEETFRIQVGLKMAGVSGEVAQASAQKNSTASGAGIVTAMDPALISMSSLQIKQTLGNLIQTKEQKVEKLFADLAQTLKGNLSLDKGQLANKIAAIATSVGNANVQVSASPTNDEAKNATDGAGFDSKVLRALLKIDKSELSNVAASQQNGNVDLSKTMKVLLAKNLSGADEDLSKTVFSGVDVSKGSTDSLSTPEVRSAALPKALEESVMNQVTEKLQTALKTGTTEIRLLLRPESLGEMRIKLSMSGDVVMGKIYVESQQVKQIVESNLQSLKDSLAQHNLQVGAFDVNVGGDARQNAQDMAQSHIPEGSEKRIESAASVEAPSRDSDLLRGRDTGRRFGTNTIEYFV